MRAASIQKTRTTSSTNPVTDGLLRRYEIAPLAIPGPFRLNISDRDPAVKILPEDCEGEQLWETLHRALNSTTYCHFGEDPIDDRSFRWPD